MSFEEKEYFWEVVLQWYLNNSLHLAPKYTRIFVRRHYLFREEHHNGQKTGSATKTCGEDVSRPCDAQVFPCSRLSLRYFVFSVLDFGEFKRFHDSIYRNLRELTSFILYVDEHDFDRQLPVSGRILFLKARSIRVSLNQGTANNYVNTVCCIHQGKYSNHLHGICYHLTSARLQMFLIFAHPA